jgi:hypothetical protein
VSINLKQTLRRCWRNVSGLNAEACDRQPTCTAKPAQQKPYILPSHAKIGAVAGSMKSGTTWLMNLLDDHPQVLSRGEMHLLGEMPVDDPVIHLLLSHYPAQWPTLQQIMRHSHEFNTWLLKANDFWNEAYRRDPQPVVEALQTDLLRFVFEWRASYVLETSAANKDIRWIIDKSPTHYTDYYDLFNCCFAAYGRAIIHLVRDPREVALSLWYHIRMHVHCADIQQRPDSLEPADRQACQELLTLDESQLTRERHFFTVPDFLRLTLRHWTEVNWNLHEAGKRRACPYLLVHYRDLKRDKADALGRIFEFLGLPFDLAALADYGKPVSSDGKQRSSTYRKGALGEWRKWFNAEDHEIVRKECGELMRVLGYEI